MTFMIWSRCACLIPPCGRNQPMYSGAHPDTSTWRHLYPRHRWRQETFAWSDELRVRNREAFGNRDFRHNQLGIMNSTLSNKDVFVLMPTGAVRQAKGQGNNLLIWA